MSDINNSSNKNSHSSSSLDVPTEILGHIFSYLDLVSLCRADQVSNELHHIISQNSDYNFWNTSVIRQGCGLIDSAVGNVNNEIFGYHSPEYHDPDTGMAVPLLNLPLLKWKNGIYHSQSMEDLLNQNAFTKSDVGRLYRSIQALGQAGRVAVKYRLEAGGEGECRPFDLFIIPVVDGVEPITQVMEAFGVREFVGWEQFHFLFGTKDSGDDDNEDPVVTSSMGMRLDDLSCVGTLDRAYRVLEDDNEDAEREINRFNGWNKISRILGCKASRNLDIPAIAFGTPDCSTPLIVCATMQFGFILGLLSSGVFT